jgi:hypothetical protein
MSSFQPSDSTVSAGLAHGAALSLDHKRMLQDVVQSKFDSLFAASCKKLACESVMLSLVKVRAKLSHVRLALNFRVSVRLLFLATLEKPNR